MKERPILFTGPMVRAILDGRKTQTRRPVRNQKHPHGTWATPDEVASEFIGGTCAFSPPKGRVGDRIWVREMWGLMSYHDSTEWCRYSIKEVPEVELRERFLVEHAANWNLPCESAYWRPSILMPRWASRIDLEITAVRVERVQDITEEDAEAEGMESLRDICESLADFDESMTGRDLFKALWQSIYGNWDANPWVWVYEFRIVKP